MLNGFLSRLTYANVVATVAVFLALGGGAYALSGIPDGSGIYHGCVASSGALRVVTKASSCLKPRTVTRGSRRVRIPGESAITWNQQGRPGINGINGTNGTNGTNGINGSPAASLLTGRFAEDFISDGYAAPVGISTSSLTESDNDTLSPAVPIVARDLSVQTFVEAHVRSYTLTVNGTNSVLTCPIPNGFSACTDTTHAVTIPASSTISLHIEHDNGSGTGGSAPTRFGWRATTP